MPSRGESRRSGDAVTCCSTTPPWRRRGNVPCAYIVQDRQESQQTTEAPVPPAVKKITDNDQKNVLSTPRKTVIQNENDWQEN